MSLSQALGAAVSGLRVTQSNLSLVAGNVANAETPGYVRKTGVQLATIAGDVNIGVRFAAVNRELDQYMQRQLRVETAGGSYADVKADFYSRLQDIYGQPGSSLALETVFNNFTGAIQALAASPDSSSARYGVVNAAQVLAQQLNGMSADIQGLRSDTEQGLGDAVSQANNALQQIARVNQQLASSNTPDAAAAALLDQRDAYIDQLSQLMDINVVATDNNQVNIFTSSGTQLVGDRAATMTFDAKGALDRDFAVERRPDQALGRHDLARIADRRQRRSYRQRGIPFGQDRRVPGNARPDPPAGAGPARPDRVRDVARAVRPDDDRHRGHVRAARGFQGRRRIAAARQHDQPDLHGHGDQHAAQGHDRARRRSGALPLPASATPDPNDTVIGVNFSNGIASVIAQINSALGSTGLQVSNPAGTTLQVLDDGTANKVDVNALSATATVTSLTGGGPEVPFFVDGTKPYSGAITALDEQSCRLCGAHRGQPGAARRPVAARGLPDLAADRGRRRDAAELPARPPDQRHSRFRAAGRRRHRGGAVQRHADILHAADDQPAGRGGERPPTA